MRNKTRIAKIIDKNSKKLKYGKEFEKVLLRELLCA